MPETLWQGWRSMALQRNRPKSALLFAAGIPASAELLRAGLDTGSRSRGAFLTRTRPDEFAANSIPLSRGSGSRTLTIAKLRVHPRRRSKE